MGHNADDLAEMIKFGLDENDKVASAEIMPGADQNKAVLGIEMDTGEQFFAEIFPA